jgi:hypothetical protein
VRSKITLRPGGLLVEHIAPHKLRETMQAKGLAAAETLAPNDWRASIVGAIPNRADTLPDAEEKSQTVWVDFFAATSSGSSVFGVREVERPALARRDCPAVRFRLCYYVAVRRFGNLPTKLVFGFP